MAIGKKKPSKAAAKLDVNKDGVLSKEEIGNDAFRFHDASFDGKVTVDEFIANAETFIQASTANLKTEL